MSTTKSRQQPGLPRPAGAAPGRQVGGQGKGQLEYAVVSTSLRSKLLGVWGREHDVRKMDEVAVAIIHASPLELVEIEKAGVRGAFLKALSSKMNVPASRMFEILGIPRATAEKKASTNDVVSGSPGQAAIGMLKLLGIAKEILAGSTSKEAEEFDAAEWLGTWIERPQPSLGGRKPADLLDTPTGVDIVSRLLGSITSGAYQ